MDHQKVVEYEEARRFLTFLKRTPYITYGLLVIMGVYFIASLLASSDLSGITDPEKLTPALILLGAKFNPFIDEGQYWRFFTALFLHGGPIHLLLNGFSLYSVGMAAENLYGRPRYLLLFLITGLISIFASYLASPSISVGASGAIFGIVGALATIGQIRKKRIPVHFRRAFGKNLLILIGLNLVILFNVPRIDHAAHFAGLFSGVAFAFLFKDRLLPPSRSIKRFRAIQATALILGVLCIASLGIGAFSAVQGGQLSFPSNLESKRYPDLGFSIQIPNHMEEIRSPALPRMVSFLDKGTFFSVEVGSIPVTFDNEQQAMEWMSRTMRQVYGDALTQLEIKPIGTGQMDGHSAWTFEMMYKIKSLEILKERQWVAPMNNGMYLYTCSAPEFLFETFDTWCDDILKKIRIN